MAFDLNEKPWYWAVITGLVLGVVLYFVMDRYVFQDIRREIAASQTEISKLKREIEKGRAAKRDLPKLQAEIRNLEMELDRLRRILPTRRETDTLLKKFKQLMETGHFQLDRFTPKPFVDKDFYWEWPLQVQLRGTYHELGMFFDKLSRFSRIINVSNLTIKGQRGSKSGYTIVANFTLQTFIYKEEGGEASGKGGQP
jgi:type IV pilus assembly protein PilO